LNRPPEPPIAFPLHPSQHPPLRWVTLWSSPAPSGWAWRLHPALSSAPPASTTKPRRCSTWFCWAESVERPCQWNDEFRNSSEKKCGNLQRGWWSRGVYIKGLRRLMTLWHANSEDDTLQWIKGACLVELPLPEWCEFGCRGLLMSLTHSALFFRESVHFLSKAWVSLSLLQLIYLYSLG